MTAMIDWSRLACPQEDMYDTAVIARLAAEEYGWVKQRPSAGEPSMFGGNVRLVHEGSGNGAFRNASFDHPMIARTESFLRKVWPAMAAQCAELLQSVWILDDPTKGPEAEGSGCTCGNTEKFGGICTTINGVLGFGHGLVHELGHWKMHAMGVHLESWTRLVANSPDEMFESPIRKDKPRPMGACIQAQYSYLHVLEFELRAQAYGGMVADMAALNAERMRLGRETLKAWKPLGEEGRVFAAAMDEWTAHLLNWAPEVLAT